MGTPIASLCLGEILTNGKLKEVEKEGEKEEKERRMK